MKRVRTFILWIITDGRFITHIFPRKILCKAVCLFYPDACRSLQGVYSQPQTSFWCCVGSGMENHAVMGENDLWTQG